MRDTASGMIRRPFGSRRGAGGFTIVEMAIAMAVIAVGICGLMSAWFYMSRTSMSAQETTVAANAARAKIDEIQGMTFSRVQTDYLGKIVTFNVSGLLPNPAGSATATQVGVNPTVLEIAVTITWTGVAAERTTTYRTRLTSK